MIRYLFIFPIKIYQICISPLIGPSCRFHPTCSNYSIESIQKYGVIKGFILSVKRLLKCHPMGGAGYDPVKKK